MEASNYGWIKWMVYASFSLQSALQLEQIARFFLFSYKVHLSAINAILEECHENYAVSMKWPI